jgi:hypothetical protein
VGAAAPENLKTIRATRHARIAGGGQGIGYYPAFAETACQAGSAGETAVYCA